MLTLEELKAHLARKDPDELVELLHISSEALVELVQDVIVEQFDELVELVAAETEEFQDDHYRG